MIATSIEDAVVEALYHEKLPIVGVQWHPERANSSSELDSKLINAFISRDFYWKVR